MGGQWTAHSQWYDEAGGSGVAPTFLTPEGLKKLQAELRQLTTEGRRHAAQRIKEARILGDLRESGEYEDAKQHQAFVEGRIRELELLLADVQIIDGGNGGEVVRLGSEVRICDEDGHEETWTIVGSAEADARRGRISDVSPVGQALMGRRARETVEVQTPAGLGRFTILEIS
jgi:transcription elongation factor GreA